MKHIVYVVILETEVPRDAPITQVDSVWDVFEHADERATELNDDYTNTRIEGIPMNDPQGGRICRTRTCSVCDSPLMAKMITIEGPPPRHVPGYECSVCEETLRV